MSWEPVYQRSLDDLLKSERARRESIEQDRDALVELLTRLAQAHNGQRLEDLRRLNPGTPKHWSAQEWENFFSMPAQPKLVIAWGQSDGNTGHSTNGSNGKNGHGDTQALRQIQQELGSLRTQLEHLQPVSVIDQKPTTKDRPNTENQHTDRKPMTTAKKPPASVSTVSEPPSEAILAEFKPPDVPYKYKGLLSQHGLTSLRWRRGSMLLYLIATRGMNSHLEIDALVSKKEDLSPRTNSTRKPMDNLASAGLAIVETLRMETDGFRTSIKMLRLTDEGRELCRALDWLVIESDWDRLIRLHQGKDQQRHTLAVMYFALLARIRGWSTQIVPDAEGKADPDVLIVKGKERHYVEVELGSRGNEKQTAKWKNLAGLQGGRVAICAPDVKVRERLVKDCQLAKIGGVATDLATLVAKRYYDSQNEPLWLKEW